MKLLGLLLLFVLAEHGLPAQTAAPNQFTSGCSELESKAILPPTHPVYPYAMDLARTLTEKGFTVKCVGESTMVGFFRGIVGGVVYDTDRGSIAALFLPKGEVFHVKVTERRENGLYLYSFSGSPRASSASPAQCAGRPCYFVQHDNVMLPFLTSHEMATDLTAALSSH
jgi:hypothetical protein